MKETNPHRHRPWDAKYQSSPQQVSNACPGGVADGYEIPVREGGNQLYPIRPALVSTAPPVSLYPLALSNVSDILCIMGAALAILVCLKFVSLGPNWKQRVLITRKGNACVPYPKTSIVLLVLDNVRKVWSTRSTLPSFSKLSAYFLEIVAFGHTEALVGDPLPARGLRGSRAAAQIPWPTFCIPSQVCSKHESPIYGPTYRVQPTRRGKLHIPNYSDHPFYSLDADSGHQTNNFGAQGNASASVRSALPRLPRIPKNPTVQSSGSFATEQPPFHFGPRVVFLSEGALDTGIGGRCHSGISMAIRQSVPIASQCGYMAPRQLSGSKRLKSRFAFFPSQSPAICVPFTGMQPIGIGSVGITQLQEHGIPLKDSNIVDGRAPSSGENSGSSLGPDNDSSGVSLNPFGPSLGGPMLTPWHRCGPDSAAQPSAEAPPPPAPLPANTTCNEYKSAWNAGFFSGCVFATRASGESSSGGSRSQSDPIGSMARVSPCPYPVNFQCKEHEAEWFAGFVAGCEFATRTSKGPESGPFPSQADLAEATRRDAPSASPSPEIHNGVAPTQQGIGLNITVAQTPPVNLETLGEHGVQTANNLIHGQASPHTPNLTTNSGLNDDIQSSRAPPYQEPPHELSAGLTSSNFNRVHQRGGDKKHKCDVCDKTFRKRYQLNDHMHLHRGHIKGHPCDFPGCDKSFTNRANMRRHQKIHSYSLTEQEDVKVILR